MLARTDPDLEPRDDEQIALQLTGHARAVAADVRRHAAALPKNDGRGALAEVVLPEADGRLSAPLERTALCAQNRARLVRALYTRLDRLVSAVPEHRIILICARQGVPVLADRAYQGAGQWVATGRKRPPGGELSPTPRTVNQALARVPVERGMARLKSWCIFRRSRVSPNRMTSIAAAVLTLERQTLKTLTIRYHRL